MSVALVSAWEPRGETARFLRYRPLLSDIYTHIVIATTHRLASDERAQVEAEPGVSLVITADGTHRRYVSLEHGLATDVTHLHYIDMDRALHWVETRPDELRAASHRVQTSDCLILGRSAWAWSTHPRSMRDTEALFNHPFSRLLGLEADFGAGSRGLSRAATEYLVARSQPGHWADVAWPVRLYRAGFALATMTVDGLDWETPDQYRDHVADAETRQRLLDAYDADPHKWAFRVKIAHEIVREGMEAWLIKTED